jgi:uncharacterized protein YkwD
MPATRLHRSLAGTGAAVAAAMIALVESSAVAAASSSCPGAELVAGAQPGADAEAAVACVVNQERRSRGLPVLDGDRALVRAGRRHAADMVRREYFSHVSPAGQTLAARLRAAGYIAGGSWAAGEVLAWGTGERSTPAAVVAAWMRSPGHRRVLLGSRYRDIGVGSVRGTPTGAAGGATYAAALGVTWP